MVLCTIPQNPMVATVVEDFMNGNVTRWNEMIRSLVRNNPGELRLLDLENMLRMIDHIALTRDGIHFNTQQGKHWINDVFQTHLREVEQGSRATSSLAWTSSTGGNRRRASVPDSLVNRLGPLAAETATAAPIAPSSNVRERLGGLLLFPGDNRLKADSGDQLMRTGITPRPCLGGTTRPLWQILLQQQDHRQAPCRWKELNQAACCFGTVRTLVIGDSTRRTCQRS